MDHGAEPRVWLPNTRPPYPQPACAAAAPRPALWLVTHRSFARRRCDAPGPGKTEYFLRPDGLRREADSNRLFESPRAETNAPARHSGEAGSPVAQPSLP